MVTCESFVSGRAQMTRMSPAWNRSAAVGARASRPAGGNQLTAATRGLAVVQLGLELPDAPKAAEQRTITQTKTNGTSATNAGPAPRTQVPARNAPAVTTQPAPPPAKAPTNTVSNIRDDRSGGEKPRAATPPEDKAANDPQLAWAREQHNTIVARVRAGDCKGAANVAVNLANRDLGYYKQNVATDRSVKECLAYIDNAREKDTEQRAERSRATQKRATEPSKRAADQPSKPADTSKATTTDATH